MIDKQSMLIYIIIVFVIFMGLKIYSESDAFNLKCIIKLLFLLLFKVLWLVSFDNSHVSHTTTFTHGLQAIAFVGAL